jgi:hypothetical protein
MSAFGCRLRGGERATQWGCTRARIPETHELAPARLSERVCTMDLPG